MNGRTYVVILFFWALLTIVTPTLVRLSASANLYSKLDGEGREGLKLLLPRRALVAAAAVSPAPAPAPAPSVKGCLSGGEVSSGVILIRIEPEKDSSGSPAKLYFRGGTEEKIRV